MKFNCKKIGCRKACFSREELREHMRTAHRPATAPVVEAKPHNKDIQFTVNCQADQSSRVRGTSFGNIFVETSPGQIRHIVQGPFVLVAGDGGLVITHKSGDTVFIDWSLIEKGLPQ